MATRSSLRYSLEAPPLHVVSSSVVVSKLRHTWSNAERKQASAEFFTLLPTVTLSHPQEQVLLSCGTSAGEYAMLHLRSVHAHRNGLVP